MLSAALAAFLSLCLFFAGGAQAWLATSYYQQSMTEVTRLGRSSTYVTTYTYQNNVKPTVTSFAPVSMETSVNSDYDITVVNVLVPTGVASLITDYGDEEYRSYTTYYVDLFLTANPSYCTESSDSWVWKTSATVSVPGGVVPTAASVITSETQRSAFGPTTTFTKAFLNPTDVPTSFISSKQSSLSYYMSWHSRSCTVPSMYRSGLISSGGAAVAPTATGTPTTNAAALATASPSTTSPSSNPYAAVCAALLTRADDMGSSSYYDSRSVNKNSRYDYDGLGIGYYQYCDTNSDCECFHGIRYWMLVPIIICSWIGFFLIMGLIESWFNFRSLARGRSARRGLPISFCMLFAPWSCFFLCCSKRGYSKKTPDEQVALEAEWKKMGFGTKLGRWLKWGFRYKYPTFLGAAPFRRTKWEEKDIAKEVARRLSVNEHTAGMDRNGMQQDGVLAPMGAPVVGQNVSGYYAPQQPAVAYAAPGVAPRDFAQHQDRGIGRNRQSMLHPVPEGRTESPLPQLPPRPPTEDVVSPVSTIDTAQESIAGPAPKSLKGKENEVVGDGPAVSTDAPQHPPVAVAK